MKIFYLLLLLLFSCNYKQKTPRSTIFIGVDVSGSFSRTSNFRDGVRFLSYYIYGHIEGKGKLSKPNDLYVGGIGGNRWDDPQDFFPIQDFEGL